jgi:hypothetical protein
MIRERAAGTAPRYDLQALAALNDSR